jgi:hypothetical protein
MDTLSLQEVAGTLASINRNSLSKSTSLFGVSLELFVVIVVVMTTAIVAAIIVVAIKKPKPPTLGEAFEEALQDLELTAINGVGPKRVEELNAAGVNTVLDLAKTSAKDLAQKTGISEKTISRWIAQARKIAG